MKFFIYCDGGLANRVGSAVSGLILSDSLGLEPVILWPQNNRCRAPFRDIFLIDIPSANISMQSLVENRERFRFWTHFDFRYEALGALIEPIKKIKTFDEVHRLYKNFSKDMKEIIFSENCFCDWIDDCLISYYLNKLNFKPDIVHQAESVFSNFNGKEYIGIHIRGTDFCADPPFQAMLQYVQNNPDESFFVCSDESAIEEKFSGFLNVVLHDKLEYVGKYTDGGWRKNFLSDDGLPCIFNVERSSNSVVSACVDLLLLSGAKTLINTSSSSFLSLAVRLHDADYFKRLMHTYRTNKI